MAARKAFFVTGTDTEVGKTLVSSALLTAANQLGKTTVGMKPVAAGCESVDGQWRNEDALALMASASLELPYEQVNPVALPAAIAPHLAAAQAGRRLSLDRLTGFCQAIMMQRADLTVIEGAGGWRVPLNEREMLSGLASRMQLPVILVVGIRLGCINHAILTAEAIRRDGLPLAGWVANHLSAPDEVAEQNVQTLTSMMPGPLLGEVPWMEAASVETAAQALSLRALLD
ncbi:dethiobiotin synthase [Pseudohongiella nitratireducens]|nr:dethiobiotin synthase [Pseudohongiella nitratireducens]MDF1622293.1 dethiobiotin synthase [Pseudohongiella nitratireducens]|tara:strand:+ start:8923 stop:9612 length:690 start_codon:yes stop_codon:yes gene_type:complete